MNKPSNVMPLRAAEETPDDVTKRSRLRNHLQIQPKPCPNFNQVLGICSWWRALAIAFCVALELGYNFRFVGVRVNQCKQEIANEREFGFVLIECALQALGVKLLHG
jgi:hypothetical protein